MDLKDINDKLIKKINSDPEFKENYNKLSDQKKKDLKEKIARYDELVLKYLEYHTANKTYLEDQAISEMKDKLSEKFKKLQGAKARAYMKGRQFFSVVNYKGSTYYVSYLRNYISKLNYEEFCQIYLEVRTSKGKVYANVTADPGEIKVSEYLHPSKSLLFYSGHFFDQFMSRNGLKGDRAKAIRLVANRKKGVQAVAGVSQGEKFTIHMKEGLGLGESLGEVFIVKTYITDELTRTKQDDLKKELEDRTVYYGDDIN